MCVCVWGGVCACVCITGDESLFFISHLVDQVSCFFVLCCFVFIFIFFCFLFLFLFFNPCNIVEWDRSKM